MRRKTEYESWNTMVKEFMKESKRKVDEEFGVKMNDKFTKKNFFEKKLRNI